MNRRKRDLEVHADGRVWDRETFAIYLAALDKRAPKRATVERLSRKDAA